MIKVEGKQVQIKGITQELINEAVRAVVAVTEAYYDLKIEKSNTEKDAFMDAADVASEIMAKGTVAVKNRLRDKIMGNTSEEETGCVPEF